MNEKEIGRPMKAANIDKVNARECQLTSNISHSKFFVFSCWPNTIIEEAE